MKIALDQLKPNPFQPRTEFTGIEELAKSMSIKQLYPVLVRKNNGHYELADGERRLRAAQLNKWTEIEADVRELSDEEMQLYAEVSQLREGLPLLDQVASVARLSKLSMSRKQIADALGKEERWIARLAKIAAMPKKFLDAAKNSGASLDELETLAELSDETLMELAQHGYLHGDAKEIVRQHKRELRTAIWELSANEQFAHAGACNTCLFNSANQAELFAGESQNSKARCLKSSCFDEKWLQSITGKIEALKADHPKLRVVAERTYGLELPAPIVNEYSLSEEVKLGAADASPVLHYDGKQAGKVTWHVFRSASSSTSPKKKAAEMTDAEYMKSAMATLALKRQAFVVDLLRENLELLKAAPDKCKPETIITLLVCFGSSNHCSSNGGFMDTGIGDVLPDPWKKFGALAKSMMPEQVAKLAWPMLCGTFVRRLNRYGTTIDQTERYYEDAKLIAGALSIDLAPFQKASNEEVKAPKKLVVLQTVAKKGVKKQ